MDWRGGEVKREEEGARKEGRRQREGQAANFSSVRKCGEMYPCRQAFESLQPIDAVAKRGSRVTRFGRITARDGIRAPDDALHFTDTIDGGHPGVARDTLGMNQYPALCVIAPGYSLSIYSCAAIIPAAAPGPVATICR